MSSVAHVMVGRMFSQSARTCAGSRVAGGSSLLLSQCGTSVAEAGTSAKLS